MYPHTGALYCGGYSDTVGVPFVALPVSQYDHAWQCGDLVYLRLESGDTLMARAMDAGPFGDNCVVQRDGSCAPIAVDVPAAFWPLGEQLSVGVEVYNFGAMAREAGIRE